MQLAFKYIEAHPLMLEADYPYTAKDGGKCMATTGPGVIKSHGDVKKGDVSSMKAAIMGEPVSVAIEADKPIFQQYKSGVISGSSCG